ncbi:Hypothetical_protein [Hexamita inflata]|uniref:Hypothetical_protein n=1 Tax=Hexamita inflata TaxID=28002 RepID=A0AA86Q054_9EUKA|nr:Hypothetical protein HINF_LOCUS32050 [Hexamita inflata]CAI9972970.1 Hypothetical protein HINF_LOCUS60615 [Hexamita inflata]
MQERDFQQVLNNRNMEYGIFIHCDRSQGHIINKAGLKNVQECTINKETWCCADNPDNVLYMEDLADSSLFFRIITRQLRTAPQTPPQPSNQAQFGGLNQGPRINSPGNQFGQPANGQFNPQPPQPFGSPFGNPQPGFNPQFNTAFGGQPPQPVFNQPQQQPFGAPFGGPPQPRVTSPFANSQSPFGQPQGMPPQPGFNPPPFNPNQAQQPFASQQQFNNQPFNAQPPFNPQNNQPFGSQFNPQQTFNQQFNQNPPQNLEIQFQTQNGNQMINDILNAFQTPWQNLFSAMPVIQGGNGAETVTLRAHTPQIKEQIQLYIMRMLGMQ